MIDITANIVDTVANVTIKSIIIFIFIVPIFIILSIFI
ncbi:MAG: hypothetical protein KZQ83_16290 [gamma proteobacterium symbiont of Taylorina sp.]|nr:hypothetical protein [gamma proteobacterium symbiont of Taylorina sp.]